MHGELKANGVSKMGDSVVRSCAETSYLPVSVPCAKL
jgi:hypothetical protein